jgi:hypothetical protein
LVGWLCVQQIEQENIDGVGGFRGGKVRKDVGRHFGNFNLDRLRAFVFFKGGDGLRHALFGDLKVFIG